MRRKYERLHDSSLRHEGVGIRVVYATAIDRVVTGYPTNTPKNPKP